MVWSGMYRGRLAAVLLAAGLSGGMPARAAPPAASPEVAQALVTGRAALEDRLYGLAQKRFEEVLREAAAERCSAGQAEEAVVLLVRTLHEQGKHAETLQFLEENRRYLRRSADGGMLAFWRAVARYEMGETEAALAELAAFETAYPAGEYASRADHLRAWCGLRQGRVDDALAAFARFERAQGASGLSAAQRLEWGRALLAAGRPEQARVALEQVTRAASEAERATAEEAAYWLGKALAEAARRDEAVSVLSALATNATANADLRAQAWYVLGSVYEAGTNDQAALESVRAGIELARSPEVKRLGSRGLGMLRLNAGLVDEGVALLKEFVSSAPEDPLAGDTQLTLARALLDAGRRDEARTEYQHYLESFTNVLGQARAHEGLGWSLMHLGRYAEAAADFLKAAEMLTDSGERAQCLFKAADAYFANAQYTLAAEAYGRVVSEHAGSALAADALMQLGESRLRAGQADEARQAFETLVGLDPRDPRSERGLLRIAEIHAAAGDWSNAVAGFSRVLEAYSNGLYAGQSVLGRGLASYRLGRYAEALGDFERLSGGSPTNALAEDASYWAGMAHYWMGREEKALAMARDFVNRFPDSRLAPRAMFWTGQYEFNRGQYEKAEQRFLMLAERYPADVRAAEALLWAGRAAALRTEYLRAIEILTRLVKEYPESPRVVEARFAQGEALCSLAEFADAILMFQEILNKYPTSELVMQAWLKQGDCELMLGSEDPPRLAEAMRSFDVVAGSANAPLDLVLQAEYKIGRCLEKRGQSNDAIEQYYAKVVLRFLQSRERGVPVTESAKTWFTRAAFTLADIFETRKEWRQAVSILERVTAAGIPVPEETRERIRKIRADYWWLFR